MRTFIAAAAFVAASLAPAASQAQFRPQKFDLSPLQRQEIGVALGDALAANRQDSRRSSSARTAAVLEPVGGGSRVVFCGVIPPRGDQGFVYAGTLSGGIGLFGLVSPGDLGKEAEVARVCDLIKGLARQRP